MSVASALAAGRRAQERLFVDTCTITRVTGRALNGSNVYVDTLATIYTGRCRLKKSTTQPTGAVVGEQSVTVRLYDLDLPWDAPTAVHVNDVATVTASDDAWVIGVPLTVLDAGLSGSTTKRRLTVEART